MQRCSEWREEAAETECSRPRKEALACAARAGGLGVHWRIAPRTTSCLHKRTRRRRQKKRQSASLAAHRPHRNLVSFMCRPTAHCVRQDALCGPCMTQTKAKTAAERSLAAKHGTQSQVETSAQGSAVHASEKSRSWPRCEHRASKAIIGTRQRSQCIRDAKQLAHTSAKLLEKQHWMASRQRRRSRVHPPIATGLQKARALD